jgi:hypothetical protein
MNNFAGTYNFTLHLGPGGGRAYSNGTFETYGSVQFATGSFTFSINPLNYTGNGNGHGTMVVTTTGFCSGTVTVPYTFKIIATRNPGQNISVFFQTPTPLEAKVLLTCTGPMSGVNTATNNPIVFLSVFPNLLTTATMPVTLSQHLSGGTISHIHISQTS